jgi:ABC-type glycerol-3-phosphate transport system substrate-binding protein
MKSQSDKWKKFSRAAAVTALLLALASAGVFLYPWKLTPYDEVGLLKKKQSPYQGVLNVWQLNDWRVGGYSRTGIVQAAARKFEKANIGVFIEFENVTEELLSQRLAEGQRPDVLSYPDGWAEISADDLLYLNTDAMPPLENPFSRAFAREPRAAPWMAGGQFVLTNSEVGRAVGVEPPQGDNTWNAQALLDYAGKAATGRRKKPYTAMAGASPLFESLALEGVSVKALSDKSLLPANPFDMGIDQARGVYTTGKCAVLLCSQWEAALMGRLAAKNKAFEYVVLPWPGGLRPCLSVQFASAFQSGDEKKDAAEVAFVQSLLSLAVQQDVANKACSLPVILLPSEKTPQGEIEKMLFSELPTAHMPLPLVPRDDAAIASALNGDADAIAVIRKRFVN